MINFSIVITTYNRLDYLKRAINSALNQTISCEVVVIDDCSDDGTLEYLKSLQNQIKWHSNSQNLGHAYSVNKGVEISQGNWIKLLDDDDYLNQNCIETMVKTIAQNPAAVICSCQGINVNEKEEFIGFTRKVSNQETSLIKQDDIHYLMLLDKLPFGTPVQVAFTKESFLKSGGWNSNFNYCYDDIDSWIKISQFGDAILINKPLVYRTIWRGGKNQEFSIQERLKNNLLIKEKIYKLVSNKHKYHLHSLSDLKKYLNLYWGLIALTRMELDIFIKLFFFSCLSINSWKILLERLFIDFPKIDKK